MHPAPGGFGMNPAQEALALFCAGVLGAPIVAKLSGVLPFPRFLGRRRGPGVSVGGVWIPDEARLRHTHIVGATGSGKTVLLEQLLIEDLARGRGALIIDPKGDRELFERVRFQCRKLGREGDLVLLSATFPEESAVWNPCGLGNVSELQSKFFNSAIYAEPHYAKWCERALLQAFNELVPEHPEGFTISALVDRLEGFCEAQTKGDEKMEGLFLDLYNLANGEWGPVLCCERGARQSRREVSLLDLTRKNQILFVDLPTEAKKVQSARIGRLLTQELMLISGLRKIHPVIRSNEPFSVYIDEFDAFATESFATFLNKARSSGFMIHIAHQTLSDLNRISPDFAGQILGNCNVRFIFRQDDPDDAERWSRFIGTRKAIKSTFQTQDGGRTGAASNRESQEFIVSPDRIKGLGIGEAILSIKTEGVCRGVRPRFRPLAVPEEQELPDVGKNRRSPATRGVGDGIARAEFTPPASESPQKPSERPLDRTEPASGASDPKKRKWALVPKPDKEGKKQ